MSQLICCWFGERCFTPVYLVFYGFLVWPCQVVENILISPLFRYLLTMASKDIVPLAVGLSMGSLIAQGMLETRRNEALPDWAIMFYLCTQCYLGGRVVAGMFSYFQPHAIVFVDIEQLCRCLVTTSPLRLYELKHAGYFGLTAGLMLALPLALYAPEYYVPQVPNYALYGIGGFIGLFAGTMHLPEVKPFRQEDTQMVEFDNVPELDPLEMT